MEVLAIDPLPATWPSSLSSSKSTAAEASSTTSAKPGVQFLSRGVERPQRRVVTDSAGRAGTAGKPGSDALSTDGLLQCPTGHGSHVDTLGPGFGDESVGDLDFQLGHSLMLRLIRSSEGWDSPTWLTLQRRGRHRGSLLPMATTVAPPSRGPLLPDGEPPRSGGAPSKSAQASTPGVVPEEPRQETRLVSEGGLRREYTPLGTPLGSLRQWCAVS